MWCKLRVGAAGYDARLQCPFSEVGVCDLGGDGRRDQLQNQAGDGPPQRGGSCALPAHRRSVR